MADSKKHKHQTGGLQEKKIKVEPTKEEIKEQQQEIKEKRKEKKRDKKKDRVGLIRRMRDSGAELRKVRWPTFGHAAKQTGVVLTVVLIFGVVVFAFDQGLTALMKLLWDAIGK